MHSVWHNQLILLDEQPEPPSNVLVAHHKIFLLFVYQFHPREGEVEIGETNNMMPTTKKWQVV